MKTYRVTHHARRRFKERLDVSISSECNRTFKKALKFGWGPDHYTGSFEQYLNNHKRSANSGVKVYENNIYIYKGSTLITVYPVPNKYLPTKIHTAKYRSENPYLVELGKIVNSDLIELELLSGGDPCIAGLSIDGEFKCYGLGNSPQKAKNHAIRTYLKSIGKEKETVYFNDQAIQKDIEKMQKKANKVKH